MLDQPCSKWCVGVNIRTRKCPKSCAHVFGLGLPGLGRSTFLLYTQAHTKLLLPSPGVFYNPIDLKWPGREDFGGLLADRIATRVGIFELA